ncbi:DUF3817 domain-containing protein [Priestia endophytica]|jgi:integral membrane protein|uniref:DUF3817 domain-containing protein n=2 Tax=Priestia endophytica TaxID=135735 RepID=A0AAX1Q1K6_9BACI|nr:DUF3817 domain-containing protein [Priestia endophytica]KAB2496133.1 DUF3817 domain-containing protein [Priestia endophytica]KYG31484.1 hypothetical protein AZF06_07020 [Priestia endophytica]MBG9811646.1 membrane protein [Priestia endophytica]MCM3536926.1 DUF3817 domain-containing protein [Priestia endophytica]RAS72055.1 hypothetical protein A3864_23545 [Priestia endophytica]
MKNSPLGGMRFVGLIEGLSLLALLGIAMPLKYMANIPEVVTVVGSIHGGLFVLYILMVGYVTMKVRWSYKWIVSALLASVIPFGNFILDTKLRKFSA